jgi:regulatory protein
MEISTPQAEWQIAALEADPRDPDRVLVSFVPAEEGDHLGYSPAAQSLSLHIAIVAQQGLRPGLLLDAPGLAALQAADTFQRIYNRALDFLALRPRSEREVQDRLRRKGIEAEDIARVIERLRRVGYLDDMAFALYWIGERARSSPRGPRLLQQELRRKGVNSAIIAQALADFAAEQQEKQAALQAMRTEEEEAEMTDEDGSDDPQFSEALTLARRKHRAYASLDAPTYRRRLSSFLLRRGYSYSLVGKVLKALNTEQTGEDEDG